MQAQVPSHASRKWFFSFGVTAILVLCPVLILNLLVDPLWMSSGNRLGGKNFAWDERQSKINRIATRRIQTECVILGTSRSTLLKESLINNGKTLNFAVSGASFSECVQFARYLRDDGFAPNLLIVEISRGQFINATDTPRIDNLKPSPLVPTSLAKGTLRFSILTLLNSPPLPRFYDADFQCGVLPNQPMYVPDRSTGGPMSVAYSIEPSISMLQELRDIFPTATFIAYLPPECAYGQKRLYIADPVGYVEVAESLLDVFDRVIDVSLPSKVTLDPSNTYDGSHYYPKVMDLVAVEIDGKVDSELHAITVSRGFKYAMIVAERMSAVQLVAEDSSQ